MRSGLVRALLSLAAALAALLSACASPPASRDPVAERRDAIVDDLQARFESLPGFRAEIHLESKTVSSQPSDQGSFLIQYVRERGVARGQCQGADGPPDLWQLVADDGTSLIAWSPGSFAVRTRPGAFLEAFLPAGRALDDVAPDPRRRKRRDDASRPAPQIAIGLMPQGEGGVGFHWGLGLTSDGGSASWLEALRSPDVLVMDETANEVKFWRRSDHTSVAIDRGTGFPRSMTASLSDGSTRTMRTIAFEPLARLDVPKMPAAVRFDLPASTLDPLIASMNAGLEARLAGACEAWPALRAAGKAEALRAALALWFGAYVRARRELWLGT